MVMEEGIDVTVAMLTPLEVEKLFESEAGDSSSSEPNSFSSFSTFSAFSTLSTFSTSSSLRGCCCCCWPSCCDSWVRRCLAGTLLVRKDP